MNVMLEILDSERAGERIRVREGLTLGRKDCDINLRDPKVSGKHARVEERSDGFYWLVDLESSNGIKIREGKVRELKLEPGVTFGIGRVSIRVVGAQGLFESTQPEILIEPAEPKTWTDTVADLLERAAQTSKPKPSKNLFPFLKPLKLSVRKGTQAGTEWTLGYGPREVGGNSIDLPLHETGLPAKCFSLVPDERDVVLKVSDTAKDRVRLNGKIVIGSSIVGSGDMIDIGDTRIEVTVIEDSAHA
jgi:hypothetical protein